MSKDIEISNNTESLKISHYKRLFHRTNHTALDIRLMNIQNNTVYYSKEDLPSLKG